MPNQVFREYLHHHRDHPIGARDHGSRQILAGHTFDIRNTAGDRRAVAEWPSGRERRPTVSGGSISAGRHAITSARYTI
jgi:hypothetical protein